MSSKAKAMYPVGKDTIEAIANLNDIHQNLFIQTLNDFFIMEGLSPDIPTGVNPGMVNVNGVWQHGILYTQYHDWKDHIDKIWNEFRLDGFGELYLCEN